MGTPDDYANLEELLFAKTTTFMERLDRISVAPVTNEAECISLSARLLQLSSDMQAFSELLMEGSQRGSIPGDYAGIERRIEIPKAAFAEGSKGEAPRTAA